MSMNQNPVEMCKIPYQTHTRNDKSGVDISSKINQSFFSHIVSTHPYVNCNKCASNPAASGFSSSMCSNNAIDLNAYNVSVLNNLVTENSIRRGGPLPETNFVPDNLCSIIPSRPESCKVQSSDK